MRTGSDDDAGKLLPLCHESIVQDTCLVLNGGEKHAAGDDWVSTDIILDLLQATPQQLLPLWDKLELSKTTAIWVTGTDAISVKCSALCDAVVRYVKMEGVAPPTSDVACYNFGGSSHCDVDVAPAELAALGPKQGEDLPIFNDRPFLEKHTESMLAQTGAAHSLAEVSRNGSFAYREWEVAERVANLFRIYPTERLAPPPPSALVETERGNKWCPSCERKNKRKEVQAKAYLTSAVRAFNGKKTRAQVTKWYGAACFSSPTCRKEILRVMNSVDHMMRNVQYVYPGAGCQTNTFAYVYPKAYDCPASRLHDAACTKTEGKFVFYLCPLYFKRPLEMVEVLVHEGSHHATAYTDDVENSKGETAYGRDACFNLARESARKALKNADNFCYYLQDVEDQVNSDSAGGPGQCHASALSSTPDTDGDCTCPSTLQCHTRSSVGCKFSQPGFTDRYFRATCTNCRCF